MNKRKPRVDDEITGADFAREANVGPSTITKLTAAGKLFRSRDHLYPRTHPKNAAYLSHRAAVTAGRPAVRGSLPGPAGQGSTDDGPTRPELEKRKLRLQSERLELQNQASRTSLIPRALVERFFRILHGIDTSLWQSLPARIAADIGALAAVSDAKILMQIEKRLDEEVFNTLAAVQKKTDTFLRTLRAGKKTEDERAAG